MQPIIAATNYILSLEQNYASIRHFASQLYDLFKPYFSDHPVETPSTIIRPWGWVDWQAKREYLNKISSLGDIVLVDNKCKQLYSCQYIEFEHEDEIEPCKTITFSLDQYHPELSAVKYSKTDMYKVYFHDVSYILKLKLKNKTQFTFLIKQGKCGELEKLLQQLVCFLPGQSIESARRKPIRESSYPKPIFTWGGSWEDSSCGIYNETIDPMMIEMFHRYVRPLAKTDQPLCILDIGAGKGRLAAKIIKYAQENGLRLHYILLEPEENQCRKAQAKLRAIVQHYGSRFFSQFTIILSTIEQFSTSDKYKNLTGKVDAVISSGGPLNVEIVHMKAAKTNLGTIKNLLSCGGILLASGLTELHVTKSDFVKQNFKVLNMSYRTGDMKMPNIRQCYVCEKQGMP